MPSGSANFFKLTKFEAGKPLLQQLSASRLNAILDAIGMVRVVWGTGCTGTMTTGGTTVNVTPAKNTAGKTVMTPFFVETRPTPGDTSGTLFQAKVNLKSDVLLSLKPNDNLTVTGLNTWFDLISNDVISLFCDVVSLTATTATIQSYGQGNTIFNPTLAAWSFDYNSYVCGVGEGNIDQTGINILIASSAPDGLGRPVLTQHQNTHVLLELGFIDGQSAIYDWSHRGRYVG